LLNIKNIYRRFRFAALAVTVALGACVDFGDGPNRGERVDDAEIILSLRLPGDFPTGGTRALSVADESEVGVVRVLIFDEHNGLIDMVRATLRSKNSFTVAMPAVVEGMRVKLVLLANADDIIAGSVGLDPAGFPSTDYATLMPLISKAVTGPLFDGENRIPMWGESGYIEIVSGTQREEVSLMRSVARIDVGLGRYTKQADGTFVWNGLTAATNDPLARPIPFEMTSVYIVRPNDRFSVAPVPANIDFSGPTAVMPSVPAGAAPFDTFGDAGSLDVFRYEVNGTNYTTREIYVPEADIRTGGKNRHRDRMAIVVGGRFSDDQNESFYRIDVGNGDQLDDVLRNHLYTFSISNVVGSGYTTVEAAYNSQSMNMTVDVLDWDQAIINNIWFEGSNYFAMDTQTVMFAPLPGETLKLNIRTNIPEFEFFYADDPNQLVRLSATGTTVFDSSQRHGYVYTLTRNEQSMQADDEYVLEIYNPRDNVGEEPDDTRRADWVISALQLRMNFHVDQRWTSGDISLQDRQGTYLTPEGTDSRPIPIEIISLYPVEIEATETVGGVQRPAQWIDLGDTGTLMGGGGADYFYYKHNLEVAPFEYGEGRDGVADRTAVISIFIPETSRIVNYTVSQQAPYVRIDRDAVSAPRPVSGTGAATVPVFVYTNISADHLQVVQTAGDQRLIRLLNGGELVAYDPRNPGNRRFDVGVVYDPAVTTMYRATFGVSDAGGRYGDLPVEYVDLVVPPANQTFDAFWRGAAYNGTIYWTPTPMTLPLGGSNYVFPWNSTEISFDVISNVGLAPDPAYMAQADIDRLSFTGPTDYDPANAIELFRYTYAPEKSTYSATSTHKLAFTSTLKPDLLTADVEFRLGVQVLRVGENAYGSRRIDWNGHGAGAPGIVEITDNVGWSADVATQAAHGDWLRVRAENGAGVSTGAGFATSFGEMDSRVHTPVELAAGQNYESNTTSLLVNDTELQFVVDPLDFYIPADDSQPESRSATITITNNDYDSQRLGASNPAPITITQWNRVLRFEGSDMPPYTLLQTDDMERTYTFSARTNLDSWRVDIWEADDAGNKVGANPVPLASKPYTGTVIWDVANAPLVDRISDVELPEPGQVKRNLLVTLSADGLTAAQEQRVGLWAQPSSNPHPGLPFARIVGVPAPPGVLGVGAETGRLTLRGSKEYPNALAVAAGVGSVATETVYIAMFKRGSLVGVSTNRNVTGYTSGEIVWAAGGYDVETLIAGGAAWANIPYIAPTQAYPTTNNIATGTGDPCSFADGHDEGTAPWKTPRGSAEPYPGYWEGPNGQINAGQNWAPITALAAAGPWNVGGVTVNGWSFLADPTVVIPMVGGREDTGTYQGAGGGNHMFWLNGGTGNTRLYINGGATTTQFTVNAQGLTPAYPIRCVPK
jgi:hypothetical protein